MSTKAVKTGSKKGKTKAAAASAVSEDAPKVTSTKDSSKISSKGKDSSKDIKPTKVAKSNSKKGTETKSKPKSKTTEEKSGGPVSVRDLIADNPYDPRIIDQLEQHLSTQASSGEYDFESNLHLLKIYSFDNSLANPSMVAIALLKAIMALPNSHFLALSYLVPATMQEEEPVRSVVEAGGLVESGQWGKFWEVVFSPALTKAASPITNFHSTMRKLILGVVERTFKSIDATTLTTYLSIEESELEEVTGQSAVDGVVTFPPNSDNSSRSKHLTEVVTLDDTARLIAKYWN